MSTYDVPSQLIRFLTVKELGISTSLSVNEINEYTTGEGITFNSDIKVNGDMLVEGNLINLNSLDIIVRDPFLYLNSGATSVTSGIVVASSPTGLNDIALGSFGMSIITLNINTFVFGDIVEVEGRGLYEVTGHLGSNLILSSTPTLDFPQKVLETILSGSNLNIKKMNVSVIRNNGGIWSLGYGNSIGTFGYNVISTGVATLQSVYNSSVPPEILITQPLSLKDQLISVGTLFQVTNNVGIPYFEVLNTGTIVNGDLTVTGLIDPPGLQLTPGLSNPGNANTIWALTTGSIQYGTQPILKATLPITPNSILTFLDGYNVNSTSVLLTGTSITGSTSIEVNDIISQSGGRIKVHDVEILNNDISRVNSLTPTGTNITVNSSLTTTNILSSIGLQFTFNGSNPGSPNTLWMSAFSNLFLGNLSIPKVNGATGLNSILTFADTVGQTLNSTSIQIVGTDITGSTSIEANEIIAAIPALPIIIGGQVSILNNNITNTNSISGSANLTTINGVTINNNDIELVSGGKIVFNGVNYEVKNGIGTINWTSNVGSSSTNSNYSYTLQGDIVTLYLASFSHNNTSLTFNNWNAPISNFPLEIRPSGPRWSKLIGLQNLGIPGGLAIEITTTNINIYAEGDDRGVLDGGFPNGVSMGIYDQSITYKL